MLKRTKLYLLLTLLVLTGFAGTIHSGCLTGKERRLLVTSLKESRKALISAVSGLSEAQLNFKPNDATPSLREQVYELTRVEEQIWQLTEASLLQPEHPVRRHQINFTDTDLEKIAASGKIRLCSVSCSKAARSFAVAMEKFAAHRSNLLKFVRTTTDDLRNHTVQTENGTIDSYQALLAMNEQTAYHIRCIEAAKLHPGFPAN